MPSYSREAHEGSLSRDNWKLSSGGRKQTILIMRQPIYDNPVVTVYIDKLLNMDEDDSHIDIQRRVPNTSCASNVCVGRDSSPTTHATGQLIYSHRTVRPVFQVDCLLKSL
jgi:hypothetical protein